MTEIKEKIHIITSTERRRRWSSEEKRSIVQETYSVLSLKFHKQPLDFVND